jgi:hypothetical protein
VYAPHFRIKSFDVIDGGHKKAVLQKLTEALTIADCAYLLKFPRTPLLYESGVRYLAEPPGRDEWQDIPDTLARGNGDCEDLACWRVAELRVRFGDRYATRRITVAELPDDTGRLITTFHISVISPTFGREDPSRILGMP